MAFLIGGIAGHALGWRWAFIIAAFPGFILALLLRFTVSEPKSPNRGRDRDISRSLLVSTLKEIWHDKSLLHLLFAVSLVGIVTFGA